MAAKNENEKLTSDENDKLKAEIYHALSNEKNDEVIELCEKTEHGPLYPMTLHDSTVLHMACYLKNFELADKLLDKVLDNTLSPEELYRNLSEPRNAWGCTVLNDAATSNKGIGFIKRLLKRVPKLIEVENKWGESPLMEAIRHGKKRMYLFLVKEVRKHCESNSYDWNHCLHFLKRKDNMTILHMAILTRQFDVALDIAKRYPQLYREQDSHGMTALQMLALSPTAFKSGTKLGPLQKLIYSIVSTDEQNDSKEEVGMIRKAGSNFVSTDEQDDTTEEVGMIRKVTNFILGSNCCIFPMIEEVRELKKGNEDALKLAKKLIESDTSWKNTSRPISETDVALAHRNIAKSDNKSGEEGHSKNSEGMVTKEPPAGQDDMQSSNKTTPSSSFVDDDEAPLHLAAKKGSIEIVKEILEVYPQAVDYLNRNQENLFHVAIRSRNQEILNIVDEKKLLRRGQLTAVDKDYNTIMHKVGYTPYIIRKSNDDTKKSGELTTAEEVLMDTRVKTPIQQLSDELQLLEKLEGLCPKYLINHRNVENLTARELFAKTNAELREKAKDFLKQTAEHCTVVTILIATVAFAAAYTVPGGPDERTGLPVLLGQPLFLVFTITDVLSLGFGLTAVVIFLTILTSQFRLKDFQRTLPQRLFLGLTLLFLSVSMMMVSFAATIILTINTKQHWTKIALYVVAFFPVIIFMLSYIPFYSELLHILNYCIVRIGRPLPKPRCAEKPKDAPLRNINVRL